MRVVFVKSAEATARLKPCLNEGNVEKTMKAPARRAGPVVGGSRCATGFATLPCVNRSPAGCAHL